MSIHWEYGHISGGDSAPNRLDEQGRVILVDAHGKVMSLEQLVKILSPKQKDKLYNLLKQER